MPIFGSANFVKGTRHRCAGLVIIERQNVLVRLRTFVTRFVTVVPGRLPGTVWGTPHAIVSAILRLPSVRTIMPWYFGHTSLTGSTSRLWVSHEIYSRHVGSSRIIVGS